MRLRSIVYSVLVIAYGTPAARADDADVALVRPFVERFFASYTAKDVAGHLSLWSTAAGADHDRRRQFLTRLLAETGPIEVKGLTIRRAKRELGLLSARISVELIGQNTQTGQPHADLGKVERVMEFVPDEAGWKIRGYLPAATVLSNALASARTPEARNALLDEEPALVTVAFAETLNNATQELMRQNRTAEALLLSEAAFAVAEKLNHKPSLAWCHLRRAFLDQLRSNAQQGLERCATALNLFREAGDRHGEAAALGTSGLMFRALGRTEEAITAHDSAAKTYRELKDASNEAIAMENLSRVYWDTKRFDEQITALEAAVQLYRTAKTPTNVARLLEMLATAKSSAGKVNDVPPLLEECAKLFRELKQPLDEARVLESLAKAQLAAKHPAEQVTALEAAVKLYRDLRRPADLARALNDLALAQLAAKRYDACVPMWEECARIYRDLRRPHDEARAILEMADTAYLQNRFADAVRQYEACAALRAFGTDRWLAMRLSYGLGTSHFYLAEYRQALPHLESAIDLLRELKEMVFEANALMRLAQSRQKLGRYADALAAFQSQLALERQLKRRIEEARALNNLGWTSLDMGRDADAVRLFTEALAIFQELKNRRGEMSAQSGLGSTALGRQDYATAERHFLEALAAWKDIGDRRGEAEALVNLGDIERNRGRPHQALTRYESALVLRRAAGDRAAEASVLSTISSVQVTLGKVAEGLRASEDALAIRRDLRDRAGEAAALAAVAASLKSLNQFAEAEKVSRQSLELYRSLGNRTGEASTLFLLGGLYQEMGRPQDALAVFDTCLTIRQQTGDKPGELSVRHDRAGTYDSMGRFAEALASFEECARTYKARGHRGGEARSLHGAANVHRSLGRTDQAVNLYEACLKTYRELQMQTETACVLRDLGGLYNRRGRSADAVAALDEALRLARAIGDRPFEASVLESLGALSQSAGRNAEARERYAAALAIYRSLGHRLGEAASLRGIGLAMCSQGQVTEGAAQYETAIKIARAVGGRVQEALAMQNLANAYTSIGRFADALQQLDGSIAIYRGAGMRTDEASAQLDASGLYDRLSRHEDALSRLQASERLYREVGYRPGEALVQSFRGTLLGMRQGRPAEALPLLESALKTFRETGHRSDEAVTLYRLANVLSLLKRYPDALARYEESLKLYRALSDRASEGLVLTELAACLWLTGKTDEARKQAEAALVIVEPQGLADQSFRTWLILGHIHRAAKRWVPAADAYRQAIARGERLRSDAHASSLQTSLFQRLTAPYYFLAQTLLDSDADGAAARAEAFATCELIRSRTLVDLLQAGRVTIRKGMEAGDVIREQVLTNRIDTLTIQVAELDSRPDRDAKQREQLQLQLRQAQDDYDQFRQRVVLANAQLRAQRGEFAPATLTELNRTLFARQPNLCILSYMSNEEDETLLFVLTRGPAANGPAALKVHRLPLNFRDLTEAVTSFRKACQAPSAGTPDSEQLTSWLLSPVAEDLAGKSHLVVVPYGVLNTLPFHALKHSDGKYLAEHLPVSYAPSVTVLVKMVELAQRKRQTRGSAGPSLLAVGRPAFGGRLKDLPASEPEAKMVASLFGNQATLLLGAEATKTAVRVAMPRPTYLHFATHGLLDEQAPFRSALALAGQGGQIQARELLDLDLSAELVVLSACETALGQNVRGEGILGLTWALFVAGAPSNVVTQWSVADESTGAFMAEFYKRLAAGTSKAEALRQAQLALLKDRKTRHPFYWAPFVLIGDWGG